MKVLLVEDNPADARLILELLKGAPHGPFELRRVGQLSEALLALRQQPPEVLLLDLGLPDSQGLETLAKTQALPGGEFPIVILTGLNDAAIALEAVRRGAQDFLPKAGLTVELLSRTLSYAAERHRLGEELRRRAEELQARNEELARFTQLAVGRELRMVELKERVNQLATQLGQETPFALSFLPRAGKAGHGGEALARQEADTNAEPA